MSLNPLMMAANLTDTGKAIEVSTNNLPGIIPSFDWETATIAIDDISRIEKQTNNQGLIVYLKSGASYKFDLAGISIVNGKNTINYDPDNGVLTNYDQVKFEIDVMCGFKNPA
jgi:hypothetical protein